jgi:hypothetical protein
MQRQTQLNDAEVTGEVSRPAGQHPHEFVANFDSELLQLLIRERAEVGWAVNLSQ